MSKSKKRQKARFQQTTLQKESRSPRRLNGCVGIVLVLVTLTTFWPVKNFEFVALDDDVYVTENSHVQSGLSWDSLIWSFKIHSSEWHPLTWLSHMADYTLYGLSPQGHHFTNLLFHSANTLILFLVLSRIFQNVWVSGLMAMLFGIHPLRIESVAWVAERKDVLSAFFWTLSMWAYLSYVERGGTKRYLVVFLFFILGLMAKPMVVTLPFILLLLDYWPLGRVQFKSPQAAAHSQLPRLENQKDSSSTIFQLFIEKIPFFILSLLLCFLTLFVARSGGAVKSIESYPVGMRISNALVSYIHYIGKMFWPHPLACFYPYPDNIPLWQAVGAGSLVLAISILAVRSARKHPYFFVGWFWYLITLVPVIGLVQAGDQAMADRFTYLPLIGLLFIIAGGSAAFLKESRHRKTILFACACFLIVVCAVGTRSQMKYWQDSRTLFERAVQVTSNNYLAHNNLGAVLVDGGKFEEAIPHFAEALRIKPNYADAHYNLANALAKQGNVREAIEHHQAALQITPRDVRVRNRLGVLLAGQGRYQEAVGYFEEVLRIDPAYADAYNNIGVALSEQGRYQEAIKHFQEALRLNPNFAEAHFSLGIAYLMTGKQNSALREYETLKTINPNFANMLYQKMFN